MGNGSRVGFCSEIGLMCCIHLSSSLSCGTLVNQVANVRPLDFHEFHERFHEDLMGY